MELVSGMDPAIDREMGEMSLGAKVVHWLGGLRFGNIVRYWREVAANQSESRAKALCRFGTLLLVVRSSFFDLIPRPSSPSLVTAPRRVHCTHGT